MIACENGIGKALGAANSCAIPHWSCAALRSFLATQPDQSGCVPDPSWMPPPFLEGRASSP